MSKAERSLREASDLAFLFQDYEMAYSHYKTAINDFKVKIYNEQLRALRLSITWDPVLN